MSKRSSPVGYTPAVDVGPLCAALRQMLRGLARSLGQWRVRIFERKFGTDFLATVPREPGIYRMYDAAGGLFYVGKARNLRRRLAQYRTARRTSGRVSPRLSPMARSKVQSAASQRIPARGGAR